LTDDCLAAAHLLILGLERAALKTSLRGGKTRLRERGAHAAGDAAVNLREHARIAA
jgi:hypothetical protein